MGHSHSHQHGVAHIDPRDLRYRQIRKVTLVGSFVDLSLSIIKILGGLAASSQALIADGIHSLSDLFTDIIVLVAAKHSQHTADAEHPYGHGRIETLATVVLGVSLMGVAIGIAIDAVDRLFHIERLLQPTLLALWIGVISIVAKEAIYHYSMTVAKKFHSQMLKANAWHSRSDAISSVIVVIGVIGSQAGLNYLDAIAAIAVAMMIAKIGWELAFSSVRELIDTSLAPERVNLIEQSILNVNGVKSLHILRTRTMGGTALVDVHIQVEPALSVSEGHHISEEVRSRVMREVDEVTDVMVHIDPEDDEVEAPSEHLPLRDALLKEFRAAANHLPGLNQIQDQDITLHYLEGKIRIALVLPLTLLENEPLANRDRIQDQFDQISQQLTDVDRITVYYQ